MLSAFDPAGMMHACLEFPKCVSYDVCGLEMIDQLADFVVGCKSRGVRLYFAPGPLSNSVVDSLQGRTTYEVLEDHVDCVL